MFRIRLDAEQLTRSRFAVSPVLHAITSLMALAVPSRLPDARPWARRVRSRLAGADLGPDFALLCDLVDAKAWYVPDFLLPIPRTATPTLSEELAVVAGAPAERVAFELNLAFALQPLNVRAIDNEAVEKLRRPLSPLVARALEGGEREFARRLASALSSYWDVAIGPDWPLIRTVLEEDLLVRGRGLATGGAATVFGELDPSLRWDGSVLAVESPHEVDLTANANGLVLAPCVFAAARSFCCIESLCDVMLCYRARGSAKVWSGTAEPPTRRGVLGERRTRLLADLDVPRASHQLAARQHLAATTVSYHLGLLHDAGLVRRHRIGKEVLYERTAAADTVLDLLRHEGSPGERAG